MLLWKEFDFNSHLKSTLVQLHAAHAGHEYVPFLNDLLGKKSGKKKKKTELEAICIVTGVHGGGRRKANVVT